MRIYLHVNAFSSQWRRPQRHRDTQLVEHGPRDRGGNGNGRAAAAAAEAAAALQRPDGDGGRPLLLILRAAVTLVLGPSSAGLFTDESRDDLQRCCELNVWDHS